MGLPQRLSGLVRAGRVAVSSCEGPGMRLAAVCEGRNNYHITFSLSVPNTYPYQSFSFCFPGNMELE